MNLLPIADFKEKYDISKNALWVKANLYREQNNGINPKWYVKTKDGVRIDEDEYFKHTKLEHEAWIYNTDPDGIYFTLSDHYKLSDNKISTFLAERSHKFKNNLSWNTFLGKMMFATPHPKFENKLTMHLEFIRLGSKLLYNCIKHERQYGYQATINTIKGAKA